MKIRWKMIQLGIAKLDGARSGFSVGIGCDRRPD
jgi:hypothetical protein